MDVIRTIKPGMPGSKRFQKHWGDRLVAVRYRRHAQTLYTTIEIIVDQREHPDRNISLISAHSFKRQQTVAVPIAFDERELREAVKKNGGRWSRDGRAWVMTYNVAVVLGLQSRIVDGLADKCMDAGEIFE